MDNFVNTNFSLTLGLILFLLILKIQKIFTFQTSCQQQVEYTLLHMFSINVANDQSNHLKSFDFTAKQNTVKIKHHYKQAEDANREFKFFLHTLLGYV